jgi:SAM-dependent methyltransferase
MRSPTRRFSDRVSAYLAYRPRYPQALIATLQRDCGLVSEHVIADIGSGTGFLSEPFLRNGNVVLGVEPNAEMREAGERYLSAYPMFTSIDGTAEDSGLAAQSAHFVVAGSAWPLFEPHAARREFMRILVRGGYVVLAWNARRLESTPFLRDYERILRTHCPEYGETNHQEHNGVSLEAVFRAPVRSSFSYNVQLLDEAGFLGRVFSSSYTPAAGTPEHAQMHDALRACFARHAQSGQVAFEYDCFVYWLRPQ